MQSYMVQFENTLTRSAEEKGGRMEPLIAVERAAELLGISPWTVRVLIRDHKLMAVHIGRRVLIEPSELRRFVEQARRVSA